MDTVALRARIADELNRQASDIVGSPSLSVGLIVNREINSAIQHYESTRFRWNERREHEFATTVANTRAYSLPASFVKMDSLKLIYSGGYIGLASKTWDQIEEQDRRVTGSPGLPKDYVIYGNVARLYPVPNGAYTLVGSYIQRVRPTSLTGSYCAIVTMGGASLTATTTASHNSQLNGWTTDGEELIRARAKASLRIRYFREDGAIAEMAGLQATRETFLSVEERVAYERLADETNDATTTGRVVPYEI